MQCRDVEEPCFLAVGIYRRKSQAKALLEPVYTGTCELTKQVGTPTFSCLHTHSQYLDCATTHPVKLAMADGRQLQLGFGGGD
jgi:hypothetical protein